MVATVAWEIDLRSLSGSVKMDQSVKDYSFVVVLVCRNVSEDLSEDFSGGVGERKKGEE